jgi:BlaI family transcriptional regulator, penicillinase repressor
VKLAGRQLAVMRLLWQRREATVAEVQQALETDPPLAYSTVATVLSRMERKGLITHRVEDRQYYYRAVVSEVGANQSVVGDLVDRVFGGSPAELVNQLLASDQVDADELERIKQLVNEHAKRTKRKS